MSVPAGSPVAAAAPPPAVVGMGLRKEFGSRVAVDDIDLLVGRGTCTGILGPNGAGKTTTLKMITGLSVPGGGELTVLGMDAARRRREVKARLGVVPQETNLDGELTVRENLEVHAGYFGLGGEPLARRIDELLELALLADRAGERIWSLSGGMKRRLLVARALVNDPELIVLDEPTTGLDPQARLAVWRTLEEIMRGGVTLLLTTHYMEEAARLCHQVLVMDLGRVVAEGSPPELVLRHAGREVLELRPSAGCDPERLVAELGDMVERSEQADGWLLLYGSDAEGMLAALDASRFPHEEARARPATLEDVFLAVAGRTLRE